MSMIHWKVTGMTCSNCALSVSSFLEKQGAQKVAVDPISGQVQFDTTDSISLQGLKKGIHDLGYEVLDENSGSKEKKKWRPNNKQRLLFTLPFTGVLMLHMLHPWIPVHFIMQGDVQFLLCLPVFLLGMWFFGKSAWKSIRHGMPNMNVLVSLGALVSFIYSCYGHFILQDSDYLFFETTASIITLVLLGNWLEERTMESTQRVVHALLSKQKVMANMIAFDEAHQEIIFPIENTQLRVGDLILIQSGEQVPIDCKVLWGDAEISEAMLTGESYLLKKTKKDQLIGGSILESGSVKAQVTAVGEQTVLSGIIRLIQQAQQEKPPLQQLADRISARFIPIVLLLSLVSFFMNYFLLDVALTPSILRSIAVLVISCPCAMGLATPAAISVGTGRAARKGILYTQSGIWERFKDVRQIVFDKTGTLTTGVFSIAEYKTSIDESLFKSIVVSMEQHSTHPIAKSIIRSWPGIPITRFREISEIKGEGMQAVDEKGSVFRLGHTVSNNAVREEGGKKIFLTQDGAELGWVKLQDSIRAEAPAVIHWFRKNGIRTILLTGDDKDNARRVAESLGIDEWHAEQRPEQKLEKIKLLSAQQPTAMVGDGINDAPALAAATIGISLAQATQLAQQQSGVLLMQGGLSYLPEAWGIGKHTYATVRKNLFWAFSYNIVAIPIAALGYLTPSWSALAMGFSDLMLGIISLHLFVKKVS
jgi:Cu+-exporting ATPase